MAAIYIPEPIVLTPGSAAPQDRNEIEDRSDSESRNQAEELGAARR